MLAGAWPLPCHKYLVLVCTQLPGGGCSPDTECRNAHSQLRLDAVPELIKFLGTQSMGVTLPGGGFEVFAIFPSALAFGNAKQKQLKWLTLDWIKDFSLMLKKKMLCNFWTHNVPRSVGTFAPSCTSANEPSWSWFGSASLVQIICPWIIECWLYK